MIGEYLTPNSLSKMFEWTIKIITVKKYNLTYVQTFYFPNMTKLYLVDKYILIVYINLNEDGCFEDMLSSEIKDTYNLLSIKYTFNFQLKWT